MNNNIFKRTIMFLIAVVMLSGTVFSGLTEAEAAYAPLPSYTGEWVSFRGNDENMGITEALTPVSKEDANLKWAQKFGQGWSSAPTPPVIVNNVLYVVVNKNVLMLNKETGEEIMRSPELEGAAGFALNPVTYAEGMIFVHVGSGRVQALRADTLESLWVSESVGGQTLTPITYKNGYVYTGTWNSEVSDGTYFCLSVKDEDTSKGNEIKKCKWKLDHKGGFYWAGAYATDSYVIFGSDDRTGGYESETAVLYSVNPVSGKVIDTIDGIKGDIRSAISYDKDTDKIYFSTKGGLFYSVKVKKDGTFDDKTAKHMETGGMSTGTPLVYNGRAYLGVCGPQQFGGTGHKYKVIDANEMKDIYSVDVPGYVQTSGLLSTAYVNSNGKVYIYTTYNAPPGGLYIIEDSKGQTEAKGQHLFIPEGDLSQYSISSLVCDRNGTIYYKNDSCYLMAIENVKSKDKTTVTSSAENEANNTEEDSIKTTLSDIETQRGSILNFDVWATGKDGKKIDSSVTLNGQDVPKTWDDVSKTSYRLKFTAVGKNIITITAGTATKIFTVNYVSSKDGEVIGKAVVSVEAFTLEGGYLIDPVIVDIKEGENSAQLLDDLLKKNGYTYGSKGSLTGGFYLSALHGGRLPIKAHIPDILEKSLIENGFEIFNDDVYDGGLGEFNYTRGSGWMYCINGIFPNVGFSDYSLSDGDVMRIQFTLSYGADVGGASAMGYNYADDYYKVADKDELTRLIAERGINNIPAGALNAAIKIDSTQEDVNNAVSTIKAGRTYIDAENHWARDGIYFVADKGLLKGTSEDKFSPDSYLDRAMLVTIVHRMAGTPDGESSSFVDVPAGHWSSNAVAWAVKNDVFKGLSQDIFAPGDKVTREQLATVLYRYASKSGFSVDSKSELSSFADNKAISGWAEEALKWAVGSGLLTGRQDNTLDPAGTATRGEIATILQRYMLLSE